MIDMPISQFERYDLSGLPRFVTRADLRNFIENLKANEPQAPVPAVMSQRPSESLEAYTTGAVASAIDNVLDSQRRAFEEAGEGDRFAVAETFFNQTREAFNAYQRTQNPVQALISTKQRLYDLESEYANSNRVSANIIADGIVDLIRDFQEHINYAMARQAAEAGQQQPRAVAMQGDPIPDMDTTELLLDYRDRLSPAQVQWLENFDDRWNGQEGNTDAGQQGLVDEYARWRNANRLAPEQAPDYLRMTHDAALQLDRQMGVDAGDELRSVFRVITEGSGLDPVRDTDAFITALRGAAEVAVRGSVETALNELADDMYTAYIRDWEPEVGPPAQAPAPAANVEQIRNRLSDQSLQLYSEMDRDGVAGLVPVVSGVLSPLLNSYIDNDRFLAAPAERLRSMLIELGHQIDMLETQGEYERAAASRLTDFHNDVEYALRDLQQPVPVVQPAQPAPAPPPAVTLSRNIDPATATFINDYIANARTVLDEDVVASVLRRINATAAYADARNDPAGFAIGLELAADESMSPIVETALRELADHFAHRAPPSAADLANQRNDRLIEAENALNDPELDPEYLNLVARAMEGNINPYWNALDADERRVLAQRFRQRANYAEFNPEQFAVQLANEAGLNFDELRDTVRALNDETFDHEVLRGLPDLERGRSAQRTALALQRNMGEQAQAPAPAAPVDVTPAERYDAQEIATGLDDAYYQGADSPQQALAMVSQHLSMLRDRPLAGYNAIVGLASDDYVYSPALIQALITELELIYTAYRDRIAGGNADGGLIRGYQAGGSVKKPEVKTPYLFSVPTYSETVAYEMYPGQKGQNDQRDAARHMLAAGTLSRKYGPKTAEFLGKAHEFTTSPLQSVKSMFTGKMPADYDMDTHNNTIGARLGQRAKSQAELEDLVQEEAERASRTQTQDKAFIKKANGGIVQQNPTTDQMRYALMMRRK
jgi:hypothetical protein